MLYSTCKLADMQMAIPIPAILEIVRASHFYPVSGAPEVIDGLINLRGKVVTVINAARAMGIPAVKVSSDSRIYIFKDIAGSADQSASQPGAVADNIGLHVDSIGPVIDVDDDALQAVPADMAHPFYEYVVRRDQEFIIILKPAKAASLT